MSRAPSFLALALLAVAGCTAPGDPPPVETPPFDPPSLADYPAGTPRECPPPAARGTLYRVRSAGAAEPRPAAPANAIDVEQNASAPRRPVVAWTWAHFAAGERPDSLVRAPPVEVWRDAAGGLWWLCARVDVAAPSEETPPTPAPITLRAIFTPAEDLPSGAWRAVVNWNVGCPTCGGTPRGNATIDFQIPEA